jgi:hypothetical protein
MLILALPSLIYATTMIEFRFRNLTFLIVAVSLLDMIFFNFQSVYEQYYLFSICAASNYFLLCRLFDVPLYSLGLYLFI